MAPDPEPPKRRRGRPANASKSVGASLSRPEDYEADVDEVRPRKRGRPKATLNEPEPEPEPAPRKRGRVASAKPANEREEPAPPKRKRGRPSLEDRRKAAEKAGEERLAEDAQRQVQDEEQPQETRRSRRKAPKPAQAEQQQPEDQPEPAEAAPRRKRGRAAQSGQKPQQEDGVEEEEEEGEEEAAQPPRKRGRPSLGTLPNEDANNKGAKATRPKKKGQRPSDANTEDAENQDENQPKKRGRRPGARNSTDSKTKKAGSRPSRDEEPDQEQQQEQQEPAPKRRGRRSHTAPLSDADDDAPPSPPKPYLHVAPQTRRIRASTIAAKWSPLSGASLPAASALLALAHQPILQRTAATRQRRQHAEAALNLVARRIARKLARGLPFPPATGGKPAGRPFADADGGRAAQLDFESVLDGRGALERQLGPAVHAVELLRGEQQRMERELERDYETLRKLEASARAQTRERKEQLKKAHVLAPTARPALQNTQDRSIITSSSSSGNVFKDIADPEVQSLGLQLAGHVESIRGNLQQGDGITPQLSRTRAALQSVLMRYLDQEAYEQVILG